MFRIWLLKGVIKWFPDEFIKKIPDEIHQVQNDEIINFIR
jgi:hypothetical protein